MVFGGGGREHLSLNQDTLPSGEPPADLRTIDVTRNFAHVTGLIKAGKKFRGRCLRDKKLARAKPPVLTRLADLWLDFTPATAGVSFQRDGATFTREVFISAPDQVIVIRLRTDRAGDLPFKTSFSSVHPTAKSTVASDELILRGQLPGYVGRRDRKTVEHWGDQHNYPENFTPDGQRRPRAAQVLYGADIGGQGMFFESRLTVKTDGKVVAEDGALRVEGATEATVWVTAARSFNGPAKSPSREGLDPSLRTKHDLREAAAQAFPPLRERQVAD